MTVSVTDDLIDAHEPWMSADLQSYLTAAGTMWETFSALALEVEGDDGEFLDGWTALYDPQRAPADLLPHLAMYVGEELTVGMASALQREQIEDRPNWRRGTNAAIFRAAQRNLTGNRAVFLKERDPDVDDLIVRTYTHETPAPSLVERDVLAVIPADVRLTFGTQAGQTYSEAQAASIDYNDLAVDYVDYDDLQSTLGANYESFVRPAP